MFSFRPEDDENEREDCDEVKREFWGELSGIEGRLSMTKTADTINELGNGNFFSLNATSRNPKTFGLVQAIKFAAKDPLVRQHVTRPKDDCNR